MNAEEQLNNLKQIPPPSKEEKRKNILTGIVLTVGTLISVLFLIFAFVKKLEADELRAETEVQRAEALKHREVAEQARVEAEHAQLQTKQQLEQALAELENCKKRK